MPSFAKLVTSLTEFLVFSFSKLTFYCINFQKIYRKFSKINIIMHKSTLMSVICDMGESRGGLVDLLYPSFGYEYCIFMGVLVQKRN